MLCGHLLCPFGNTAAAGDESAHSEELATLMTTFAASGIVRARFRETRHISLLTRGLESSGTLYFAPGSATEGIPDRLARHTAKPAPSRVVVRGALVVISDATGVRRLDLSANDGVRGLLGNLAVLLRGDLPELRRRYTVSFLPIDPADPAPSAGGEGGWRLDLHPRDEALAALIEHIEVRGVEGIPRSMETLQTNGDRTLLRFTEVETGLALQPAALERIFSAELPGATDGPTPRPHTAP